MTDNCRIVFQSYLSDNATTHWYGERCRFEVESLRNASPATVRPLRAGDQRSKTVVAQLARFHVQASSSSLRQIWVRDLGNSADPSSHVDLPNAIACSSVRTGSLRMGTDCGVLVHAAFGHGSGTHRLLRCVALAEHDAVWLQPHMSTVSAPFCSYDKMRGLIFDFPPHLPIPPRVFLTR